MARAFYYFALMEEARQSIASRPISNRFRRPGVLSPEFLNILKASAARRGRTPSPGTKVRFAFDSHEDESPQLQEDDLPLKVQSEPAIKKFKRAVNVVRRQLPWFRLWAQDAEDCCKGFDDNGPPSLNLAAFRPASEQLSRKAKLILMKPNHTRSAQELRFLDRCIVRLKCFDQYSFQVRKQLSNVLYFEAFEKGRVIIRQGRKGQNFYFIVSGCVAVELEEPDKRGRMERYVVAELRSGSSFGERALLGDDRRTATVVCREYSEFLRMDNLDFEAIIRSAQERDCETRSRCVKEHPILHDLDPRHHKLAADASRIMHFPTNSVILKDLSEPTGMVYFVTKGYCKVVQRVQLWKVCKTSKPSKLILPPLGGASTGSEGTVPLEKLEKLWVLKTLNPGDYFGIGEGPINSSVITDAVKLECLSINTIAFTRHHKGRFLSEIQELAKEYYPSLAEAFSSYIDLIKWKEYKERLVQDVVKHNTKLKRKNFPAAVPVVLRDYRATDLHTCMHT